MVPCWLRLGQCRSIVEQRKLLWQHHDGFQFETGSQPYHFRLNFMLQGGYEFETAVQVGIVEIMLFLCLKVVNQNGFL